MYIIRDAAGLRLASMLVDVKCPESYEKVLSLLRLTVSLRLSMLSSAHMISRYLSRSKNPALILSLAAPLNGLLWLCLLLWST